MSRLEELIKELCPDGVEYKTLAEMGKFLSGLTGKSKEDFNGGSARFITYMNVFDNLSLDLDVNDTVRIGDNENQNIIQYGDVIFTGSSETLNECGMSSVLTIKTDEKLYLNSFCFIYRFNESDVFLPSFSKYLFRSNNLRKQIIKTASGVTRFNVSKAKMGNVRIPIIPIEVQKEIVKILDDYTASTTELKRQLLTEYTIRKKQYEYYRDELLTFKEDKCEWKSIKEIFDVRNGYTPSKAKKEYWEKGIIPWFRMDDIRENGRVLSYAIQSVTMEAVKNKPFPANSIIISTSATIGEHALITTDFMSNQRFTCLSLKEKYKDEFDMMFIFYYCFKLSKFCLDNLNQSSFASVDMSKFCSFMFPVISIEEQKRIVSILDRFDKLCNDISEGILAEIEARQKQYEYYRDKVLSFKEVSE